MHARRILGLGLAGVLCVTLIPPAADAAIDGSKAVMKLVRGGVNLVTGCVEIPKRIHETSQTSGAMTAFTWGTLRGCGYGFVRTAAGAYELVTFLFPAPPDYAPVIQPEFVFLEESDGTSAQP